MSTNVSKLAFTESGNGVNVRVIEPLSGSASNVEADTIDFQVFGVMVSNVDGGTRTTWFVPYSNIASIEQTESI